MLMRLPRVLPYTASILRDLCDSVGSASRHAHGRYKMQMADRAQVVLDRSVS